MEASALHAPAGLSRLPLATQLLRLRSDEQLVALFRAGSDEAFGVLHDRYRQRLFAYVRQMLSSHSRQDAEDVLQDVFVRAFGALRGDSRAINVRAWLYRVAHNRCIDHLRRPHPPAAEIFEMSRKPLLDPVEEAQRRDDLKRLVGDLGRLPDQQRSALLMREIDGLSYAELADSLDVTVPAVKSLLVRARVGLVEAQESRDADCGEIRRDLMASYDRGVKASGRARRHMRECEGCREYRQALRGVRRSFAALTPAGAGPIALLAKLIGAGGAGGGAAAAGGGGSGRAGGQRRDGDRMQGRGRRLRDRDHRRRRRRGPQAHARPRAKRERVASATAAAPARSETRAAPAFAPRVTPGPARSAHAPAAPAAAPRERAQRRPAPDGWNSPITAPPPAAFPVTGNDEPPVVVDDAPQLSSGGTAAPAEEPAESGTAVEPGAGAIPADGSAPAGEAQLPGADAPVAEASPAPASEAHPDGPGAPPAEH